MLPSIFSENLFDNLFDYPFEKSFFNSMSPAYTKAAKNLMRTDVKENDNEYELSVELPGFNKDDVNLELKDGYLTISAHKTENNDEKDKNGKYIRQERYSGSCSRTFYVGNVKPEDVGAKYQDGVLTLKVPKKSPQELTAQHKIAIE